jgi:hypothetical protein
MEVRVLVWTRWVFALAALLLGCSNSGNIPPTASSVGPGPLSVTPANLSFVATGQTQTLTVSDPNYTGTFKISGCSGVVTSTAPANSTLSITASATGSCTLALADGAANQTTIAITVATFSIPIQ